MDIDATTGKAWEPTFLGLPVELRLIIYEALVPTSKRIRPVASALMHGNGTITGLWALSLASHQIRQETMGLLPQHISDVIFIIDGLDRDALGLWITNLGPERLALVRKVAFGGEGTCLSRPQPCEHLPAHDGSPRRCSRYVTAYFTSDHTEGEGPSTKPYWRVTSMLLCSIEQCPRGICRDRINPSSKPCGFQTYKGIMAAVTSSSPRANELRMHSFLRAVQGRD